MTTVFIVSAGSQYISKALRLWFKVLFFPFRETKLHHLTIVLVFSTVLVLQLRIVRPLFVKVTFGFSEKKILENVSGGSELTTIVSQTHGSHCT